LIHIHKLFAKLVTIGSLMFWLSLGHAQTTFIPDVPLIDQDGKPVLFYSDLIKGKTVAMNFIFTSCGTVSPIMGAQFGQLQRILGDQLGKNVSLISVSIDPVVDTPQRLKAWGEQFGAGPGWTLVTGSKRNIDTLLKGLEVFAADKNTNAPTILMGDETRNQWQRVSGLTPASTLANLLRNFVRSSGQISFSPKQQTQPVSPTQRYFTDVALINQHGQKMRLYSDFLKDKVVVINTFYSTCESVCPVTQANVKMIQEHLGKQLGKEVHIISLTVDPQKDTPSQLHAYAEKLQAKPGWHFLTGEKQNLDFALQKFGQLVKNKESHSTVFIMGNVKTGLWKKAMGMANPQAIIQILDSVLDDKG
jgi:protein SCO1/2